MSQGTARRHVGLVTMVTTGTAVLYGGYQLTKGGEEREWGTGLFSVLNAAGATGPQPSVSVKLLINISSYYLDSVRF